MTNNKFSNRFVNSFADLQFILSIDINGQTLAFIKANFI